MDTRELNIVTAALLLSNAMAGLDGTIINTALPAIISDLHGISYMGWIISVFLLGMAVSTPLWSKLGERIGNKKAYQIATTAFAIGAIFQASAGNIWMFLAARAVMGIGAGGMNTIPFIIYADIYENLQKRAKIIAFATASFSAASIIGPLIGGWIVDVLSWHWVFYINIPIALISIMCMQFFFKQKKIHAIGKKIDFFGAVLMVSGLIMLLLGIQMIESGNIAWIAGFIVLGLILLAALVKVEEKAADPIIPNRLFKNPALVVDFLLFALLWGAFIAFNIYGPMWAQGLLGVTALVGGLTQIPGSITNFIGSIIGPPIQLRSGKYYVILLGTGAFLAAFMALSIAGVTVPLWFLLIAGAFQGLGLGLCFNILQLSVQKDAERKDIPIATSFAYLLRILSQTFMAAIYGAILNYELLQGVEKSNGTITIAMLNKLSDYKSISDVPMQLLPAMRNILHNGLHDIMVTAVVLLIIALIFNLAMQFKEKNKRKEVNN